ncbi:MAG TPA: cytochrome c biogenesis protein CcdA [Polyangia bacterium]|nr:cytochrome c biogenesis protein CcdA [Polyangia bacterium]
MAAPPTVVFAVTAGLLTALTPCVYPMIPITISIFGAKAGVSRARALLLATAYVAGIAAMFGTLGTVFALLGKAFGTFLANPWVIVPLAIFFVAMGLSMFGAFELAVPASVQNRLSRVGGKGFGGAFLMGLVGGIIAAPCTGPPLAAILAYVATTRDAVYGFALLSTYAVGFGVPFWILAGFSMSLPRSGTWMDAVKSVFGIALFTAALYYLKLVVPSLGQLTGRTPLFLMGALAVVALGLALGAVHLSFHDAGVRRMRKGLGVALTTLGLFAVTNYVLTPKGDVTLAWMHDEPAAVASARQTGKPLLVDFSATWCLPCKELEVHVFARPEVALAMSDFTLLKIDLTREDDDPALPLIKKKYAVDTLPAIRLVSPAGAALGRTDEVISPAAFLELLARAKP